jgi:hypothetical protein
VQTIVIKGKKYIICREGNGDHVAVEVAGDNFIMIISRISLLEIGNYVPDICFGCQGLFDCHRF